jgi:hypothetical protein
LPREFKGRSNVFVNGAQMGLVPTNAGDQYIKESALAFVYQKKMAGWMELKA